MEIPRFDDPASVLRVAGELVPMILRESVDHGWYLHAKSRALDPEAFADYSACSLSNMLYDRIASVARPLVDAAASSIPGLRWTVHSNKRSTEIFLDPYLAFRIKRSKKSRGNLIAAYPTKRQRDISNPRPIHPVPGQIALEFPGLHSQLADGERVWVTTAFDLDDVEESIKGVWIGVQEKRRWSWREPLLEGNLDTIARLSKSCADEVQKLRKVR